MNGFSEFSYYPIKRTNINSDYVDSLKVLAETWKTVFSEEDFLNIPKIKEVFEKLNFCKERVENIAISSESTIELGKDITRLGIFANNKDKLYSFAKYIKFKIYKKDLYISSTFDSNPRLLCCCNFRFSAPKILYAIHTDKQYQQEELIWNSDSFIKNIEYIKKNTKLDYPKELKPIVENIKNDIKDNRIGLIVYKPLRGKGYDLSPFEVRNTYKK